MSMAISAAVGLNRPDVMSGASARAAPKQKMTQLFEKIDGQNNGTISRSQFAKAFETMSPPKRFKTMSANEVFNQLTTSKTNSVNKADFVNGMTSLSSSLAQGKSPVTSPMPPQSLINSLQSLNGLGTQVDILV
ncbi:MAG: EF-hand domain-containing protein [Magnetovibrio sp.]|nr:EF-hand domain-containing protein [Magnetovibrio sp.]